jgi:hypothetical protein
MHGVGHGGCLAAGLPCVVPRAEGLKVAVAVVIYALRGAHLVVDLVGGLAAQAAGV